MSQFFVVKMQILVITLLVSYCYCVSTPPDQISALEDLYYGTNGANWYNNSNWLTGDPCSNSWYGIICFQNSTTTVVQAIDLQNNNLIGTLPNLSLQNISYYFYLNDNQLTGTIPNFNMPFLTSISLSENQLSGTIPNFTYMLGLLEINFQGNNLSGTIPSFSKMQYLSQLSLDDNNLTGSIPNFNIPNLSELFLDGNQLSGSIPNFNYAPNLMNIDLEDNQLTGSIPNFNLPNLSYLTLDTNLLTGSIPNFNGIPNVWRLSLQNNQLSNKIPNFNYLSKLSYINLKNNQLSGTIPFFSFPSLTELYLSNNQLTGTITSFTSVPKLSYLYLDNNQLSGTIPNFNNVQLSRLFLNGNNLSGVIPNFNLPNLSELSVAYNDLIGELPSFNELPSLHRVELQENKLSGFIAPELIQNFKYKLYNFTNNNFTCPVPIDCIVKDRCDCAINNVVSLLEEVTIATLAFLNNSNDLAEEILDAACHYPIENEDFTSIALSNLSCQWVNNLKNGYNFFGERENTITKLSWEYYNNILNYQVQNILIPYETLLTNFEENIHNQQQWKLLTNEVISHANAEALYWNSVSANATTLADTEANLIIEFRSQLNLILDNINDDFIALQNDIASEISKIQSEITTLSSSNFFEDMFDIGEVLIGSVLSLCGLPTESLIVSGTVNLIDGFFQTLSDAQKVTALQDAIVQLEDISIAVGNSRLALDSVAEFYSEIALNSSLPSILPSLYLNEIEISTMDMSLNEFADQLLQWSDLQILREQVNQLTSITKQYSQAIINWYILEMKIQSYSSQGSIASNSADSLSYLLKHEEKQQEAFAASYITAWQFQVGATFRILVDMLYVQRQYNFYALSNFSFSPYLPFNPSSNNIIFAQQQLYNTITSYLNHASTPNQVTANYTLTAEHNNSTFQQLWSTGTAYFVIDIPKLTSSMKANHEFYYEVNVLNIQIYPSPIVNPRFSTINVKLTQLGDNIFYDSNARLWNFTTNVYDFEYVFQVSTLCGISSPYVSDDVNYIHYSPYGIWKLEIPTSQMSVEEIDTIYLYFTLYLSTNTAKHIPLWGFYPYIDDLLIPPLKC